MSKEAQDSKSRIDFSSAGAAERTLADGRNHGWRGAVRSMLWAAAIDTFHRSVSLNMLELRRGIRRYIQAIDLPRGSKVLDFGCGTGLYAGMMMGEGLQYHGYDIDPAFVRYAGFLHPGGRFHSQWETVPSYGPFELVVVNCCFHHMSDAEGSGALTDIQPLLSIHGVMLFIDHIPPTQATVSASRRTYRLLERGEYIRRAEAYENLIRPHMVLQDRSLMRSYVLSFASRLNPLFNELVVLRCVRR